MLVLQEALPGDRQFWLTRPHHWLKLLAVKILFIVLLVNVPLLMSDCYILAAQSLPVLGVIPELFLRQGHMTLLFILPSFALATLVASLAQFLLAWFGVILVFVLQSLLLSFAFGGQGVGVHLGGWALEALGEQLSLALQCWL